MLKIQKRGREWNEFGGGNDAMNTTMVPCSPHIITTLDSTPTKRIRSQEDDEMVHHPQNNRQFNFNPSPAVRQDSPFSQEQQEVDKLISLRKQKKAVVDTKEKLFNYEEVKEIVRRAVTEREMQLRAEYDQILQEKLQEQFRHFSKFNEDYISRQLKQSDFSYLS